MILWRLCSFVFAGCTITDSTTELLRMQKEARDDLFYPVQAALSEFGIENLGAIQLVRDKVKIIRI
jgi:hypothetical protein